MTDSKLRQFSMVYLALLVGQSFFCCESNSAGIEVNINHRPISSKYYSGPFLIYNCVGKYWACVDDTGYELCQQDRYSSLKQNLTILACAPVEKYESMKDCFTQQQTFIDTPQNLDFCLHPIKRL
jgi:hypothetical protein